MTDTSTNTSFTSKITTITAGFLDHVNTLLHTIFDGAETKAEARTALDVYSKSEADSNFLEGPGTSTDNAVARYDGVAGEVQDSGVTIDDSDNVDIPGTLTVDGVSTLTGNVSVGGTVDGRDLATDGTKLDGIESSADVTDEANVTSALDGATISAATVASTDKLLLQDVDDSDNLKTATAQSVADLASATSTPTVLFKSANYTITSNDVDDPSCIVYVDASGGSVTNIQLPTVAELQGKIAKVIAETDPGTNTITVNESDGSTEIATLVEKHDSFEVTSDGSAYKPIGWKNGHYARVYVDADESIAAGASEHITSISEHTDTGGIWNTTNDEVDIPFDCWVDLHWNVMSIKALPIFAEAKLDTTYLRDASAIGTHNSPDTFAATSTLSLRFKATSGQKLELWAFNFDGDTAANILGDAAGDESFATIKLDRIY